MAFSGRIVLTRTAEQNLLWQKALENSGLSVLSLPMIRFRALSIKTLPDPSQYDWILFTSPQGVKAFFAAGLKQESARMGVLGSGTADALTELDGEDQLGVRRRDGAEFAQAFLEKVEGTVSILLPGPERRLEEPAASLRAAGHTVDELPLYRTEAVPADQLPADKPTADDMIFFASPSTARAYHAAYGVTGPCVAIGKTTAAAARDLGYETIVADNPNLEAMALAVGITLEPEMKS
jgi:uroporphyrinogen-III synthase